jgi:hypothetical protein
MPRSLASMGLLAMDIGGRAIRRPPFERAWMRHYVDKRLEVDNRRTRECLGWTPNPRFQIERRLPFLIERLKSEPFEWLARNTAILTRQPLRPDLRIYHALLDGEDQVVRAVTERLSPAAGEPWRGLLRMDPAEREWYVRLLYRLLLSSVQNSNRMLLLNYLAMTAQRRFELGFTGDELSSLLDLLREEIRAWLTRRRELSGFERELHERVSVPLDLGKDEILDQWERRQAGGEPAPLEGEAATPPLTGQEQLAETIWQCLVQRR